MKRNHLWFIPTVLSVLVLTSCSGLPNGSGSGGGGGNNNTQSVTFTMISQSQIRPGNFTILAWSATIDSLSLNESGGTSIPLNITTPIPLDFARLSTDSLLIGNFTNIPAGITLNTMTMALSHFIITISNETGGNIGANCPNMAICEFSPAPATVTIASTLAVAAGKTANVFFTIFPSNIISVSNAGIALSFTGNTSISEQNNIVRAGLPANAVDTIEDFTGVVTAVSGSSISLKTGAGLTLGADTSSATLDDPQSLCSAATKTVFACAPVGSIVSLDGDVNLNGTVTATEVDLLNTTSEDAIEGTIFSTGGGNFSLVVTDKQVMSTSTDATLMAANIGDIFVVNGLTTANSYTVDTKTLSTVTAPIIPTNLFTSSADLLNGQTVRLHVASATGSASTNNQTLTTDAVQLRWTRVTASANTPTGSIVGVTGVGSIFQLPITGSGMVQTYSPGTTLDGIGSLQAIGPGGISLISTRALFLNDSPNFFAAKIRGQ